MRSIAAVTVAVASGDLSQKVEVEVKGEILQLKQTGTVSSRYAGGVLRKAIEHSQQHGGVSVL